MEVTLLAMVNVLTRFMLIISSSMISTIISTLLARTVINEDHLKLDK